MSKTAKFKDSKVYKKRALDIVLKSLRAGNNLTQACQDAGIDISTLWLWRKKYKDVDEKVEEALYERNVIVEDALFEKAIKGNVTAQIFWLCNRLPERWKNVQKIEASGFEVGNIEIHISDANVKRKQGRKNES